MACPVSEQRIAYILEIPSTWILTEVDALYKYGLKVLLCLTKRRDEKLLNEKQYHCVKSGIGVVILETMRVICRHPVFCIRNFFKAKKHIGVQSFLRMLFLLPVIQKQGITHIHAHFGAGGAHIAMMISELTGIPFSFTTHAFDIFRNDVDYTLLREKIEKSQWVRCTYHYNKEFFLSRYPTIPEDKYAVIHLAVHAEKYAQTLRTPHPNFHILSVSNLVEKKGLEFLVKACRILKDRGYSFSYTMIGNGPERKKLEDMVASFDLLKTVNMVGNVPNKLLPHYFETADVFVLPCIQTRDGDMDGIPTALMEAMAAGIPAISTKVSGIPELIQDMETGLLVNEKNEYELVSAIEKIMKDPLLAGRCAQRGKEKVAREFNIEYTAQEIASQFQRE